MGRSTTGVRKPSGRQKAISLAEAGRDEALGLAVPVVDPYVLDLQEEYYKHLHEVGYYPHSGQSEVLGRLFHPKFKFKKIFMQCGRNFGKSTTIAIAAVFFVGTRQKFRFWIAGPELEQMEEAYYHNQLVNDLVVPRWWPGPNGGYHQAESRWTLLNQSFIKLFGVAKNKGKSMRGLKPHGVAWDEVQDVPGKAYSANEPNLLAYDAFEIIAGTPPDFEGLYTELANDIIEKSKTDKRYWHLVRTTWDNPRISRESLQDIKERLFREGKQAYYEREYMAKFIPGGTLAVLPQFSREKNLVHTKAMQVVVQIEKGQWEESYVVYDPSSSGFAASGFIYNRYKGKAYWVWGFEENDPLEITTSRILERVKYEEDCFPQFFKNPIRIYDEAQKLWALDMMDRGIDLIPTQKYTNTKEGNIKLARDILDKKKLKILEHLEQVCWQLENYHYDENQRIVKKKDGLVDTLLYFLAEVGYSSNEEEYAPDEVLGDPEVEMREKISLGELDNGQLELGMSIDLSDFLPFGSIPFLHNIYEH